MILKCSYRNMIFRISKNYRKKPVSESFFLKRNSNSSARVFTMNFAKVLQNTFEQLQFYYSNCSKTYFSFWQQNVCFYFCYLSATLLKRDSDSGDFCESYEIFVYTTTPRAMPSVVGDSLNVVPFQFSFLLITTCRFLKWLMSL